MNWLRPFIARAISAVSVGIAAKLAEKTGLIVDPASLITASLAVYGVLHTIVSKKSNPLDAATTPLAEAGKVQSAKADAEAAYDKNRI